jgi:hypothetical protein
MIVSRSDLQHTRAAAIVLLIVSVMTMIALDRPLVRGDGVAYLAWLDSFVLDGDSDLMNQRERLAAVNTYQVALNYDTGKAVNVFPFGVAMLHMPFYAVGHVFAQNGWWNANPAYFAAQQGVSQAYSLWIMIGANVLMLGAMLLLWDAGRRICGAWGAALAAYALFVGTPLIYYSTITPLNSHNGGAFTLAVFFYIVWRISHNTLPARPMWLVLLGVAAAGTIMARWQLAPIVALGFGVLLWERRWSAVLMSGVAAAAALLPLPLIWQQMFGAPFVIPYNTIPGNESFIGWPQHIGDVAVTTLLHSPVLLLSVIGLWRLRTAPPTDTPNSARVSAWLTRWRWPLLVAAAIAVQVVINGAALDWWAGDSYGMRRMSELYILYGLALCALIGPQGTGARGWRVALCVVLVGVVLYSALYMAAFLDYTWTNLDGAFIAAPQVMIERFLARPDRWEILRAVVDSHVGPSAWAMPGP